MGDARQGRVYLDHAATTAVRADVAEVVARHLRDIGNPASAHASGRRARAVVEEAREAIAEALDAPARGVVFTSGGTEADNLAVKGWYWARSRHRRPDRPPYKSGPGGPARIAVPAAGTVRRRVIVSAVEHHAVLDAAGWLAGAQVADVRRVPVDGLGRIDLDALRGLLAETGDATAVVSVMWANNEVGTVQPIEDVVHAAHEFGVPVHSDAVQAFGAVPVSVGAAGVDAVSVSGHKLGGPPGVGALVLTGAGRDADAGDLVPVLHGGGQEWGLRSGSVPVPLVAGFAVAARAATAERQERADRLAALRTRLVDAVRAAVPDCVVNGDPDPAGRLPGIAHISFPGCEGDSLLLLLDREGIDCSTGSACAAGVTEPSHVLLAMGGDPRLARSSLRFSLGETSTQEDVDALARVIGGVVRQARTAGVVNVGSV